MGNVEIVIPCFNEEANLEALISDCKRVIDLSLGRVNFILVDNGSTDRTSSFMQDSRNLFPGIRFVTLLSNCGYGGGIIEGLKHSHSEFVGWTHADLQTPLTDCLQGLELLNHGYDFVKGRRNGRPLMDKIFSKCMGVFESALFGMKMQEINAQPTLFRRDFFKTWGNIPEDFSLDLYALVMARQSSSRIVRFDVNFLPRRHGSSKWNSGIKSRIRFIIRTLIYSFQLKRDLS